MDTQEARIYIAIIITVILLGIIITYFTISVIRQQRRNLELQKANALAEISAMEKERARIAADLHDDLGPVLSVIKFRVDHVEQVDKEEKAELEKASAQLDELIGRMREVANNLMPSALQRKGLIAAVNEFVNNAGNSSGVAIRFTHPENVDVNEEKCIHIYRIVQEAVHNCIKHAQATDMQISFEQRNGSLHIRCQDNGNGFDTGKVLPASPGIGMRSLRNRTGMMGGTINVQSSTGKGTTLLFEIPVK